MPSSEFKQPQLREEQTTDNKRTWNTPVIVEEELQSTADIPPPMLPGAPGQRGGS